jgi:hypothetical protein
MKTKTLFMIVAISIMIFTSCKKDIKDPDLSGFELADDDAVSEAVFEDVFNSVDNATIMLDEVMKGGPSKSDILSEDSCPVISVTHPSTGIWPKVLTLDFGAGCTGFFENTRSGKIIMEVTGPRYETGSKRIVTFDNYYFNGIKVEGEKVFENLGLNESQNPVISVKLTGGKLILPDGTVIERTADHQREWIAGFGTWNIWDDECLVTGVASGINFKGYEYTRTITTALHWKRVCKFIVSGVIKIEREGAESADLDYGSGDCDNKATVTVNGETREIELRHKHRNWIN